LGLGAADLEGRGDGALRTKKVEAIHFDADVVIARVKRMGDLFEPSADDEAKNYRVG